MCFFDHTCKTSERVDEVQELPFSRCHPSGHGDVRELFWVVVLQLLVPGVGGLPELGLGFLVGLEDGPAVSEVLLRPLRVKKTEQKVNHALKHSRVGVVEQSGDQLFLNVG